MEPSALISLLCKEESLIFLRRPKNLVMDPAVFHDTLKRNKPVASAITASLVSTFAGYPLDSLKSRLQASRVPITVPRLAAQVFREEGIAGFYRGFWIPLFTISFVRSSEFRKHLSHFIFKTHGYPDRRCIIYDL